MRTLKQLSDAATRGGWYGVGGMVETDDDTVANPACCIANRYDHQSTYRQESDNAEFIAALVNAYRDGKLVEK